MRGAVVPRAVLARLAMLAVLVVACGDAGRNDPGNGTTTPGLNPQPTPIPLSPVLPDGVRPLGNGYRTFALVPQAGAALDTLQAARDAGITPPACAEFVFAMHWSVDGPGALNARVESVIQGTSTELGTGPEGRATVGCTLLRFSAPDTAFLNVAFVIGSTQ